MTDPIKIFRCAIYTRKSTDHNLDLEFNSLDAQREACEAYIKSQAHEGWRLVPGEYNDGGLSGASLDRPALQALLSEIRAGRIDTVVVYKIDRLTRSLTDFAKLVESFDQHAASFVSITQSFNTTTSMGRLTLNVLLSFAQFEREVISERVRDKIAASKRKGFWMGGTVPLGYENVDKRLIAVPHEAETVRWIFQKYLELGAIGPLLQALDREGIRTKRRPSVEGNRAGGGPFGKGSLNNLLKNRTYVGEIRHKLDVYTANHEPILDRELFDAVQTHMANNKVPIRRKIRGGESYPLTGFIFDSAGNRMTPSHSAKKRACYRYYVSQAILQRRAEDAGEVARIAAPDIEAAMDTFFRSQIQARNVGNEVYSFRQFLKRHVSKIFIRKSFITVQFKALLEDVANPGQDAGIIDEVSVPWGRLQRESMASQSASEHLHSRELILTAIGKSRVWVRDILAGSNFKLIAQAEGKCERHIRLLIRLAFASPKTVDDLIRGDCEIGAVTALAKNIPLTW